MHTLIICGTPWCELPAIYAQIRSAGLAAPIAAVSGGVTTIGAWHDRLFAHNPQPTAPVHPGKAWEQAAGEIFLANWEQALWGWADARSTWLLDFWLQFDPQVRFVLVHTPAVDALVAAALHAETVEFDANRVLDTWCAYQTHMLQFGLRHKDRCVWFPHVPSRDIVSQNTPAGIEASAPETYAPPDEPAQAVLGINLAEGLTPSASLALQWGVPIELPLARPAHIQRQSVDPTLTLLHSLAVQAVLQHPQASALQQEVWACLSALGDPPVAPALLPDKHWAAKLLSQVRQVAIVQMGALRHQMDEQTRGDAQDRAGMAEQCQALTQALDDLQQQLGQEQQANQALKADLADVSRARNEIEQEAEVLLLQLHQVQEELEKTFLESADLRKQMEAVSHACSRAEQQRDVEAQAKAELQQQLQQEQQTSQALKSDLANKSKALNDTEQEAELILRQLHQVQEELEKTFLESADLRKQMEAVSHACSRAEQQRDVEGQANAELQQQLQQEQQTSQALKSDLANRSKALNDTEQEAELILLQLHQVQEELEQYFLKFQGAESAAQQLQQRLTRWAQRYPDHCEWESLAVLPHTKPHWQEVLITQLQHGGRTLPQLHLQLHHTKRHTQLMLRPANDGALPLLRWPIETAGSATPTAVSGVLLDPSAKPGTPEFANLAALTPSDLQLLQAVCNAVAQHLQTQASTSGAGDAWHLHWQSLAQGLAGLPPIWRFDYLSLRHEQVNPDYEHLWFHFEHAQYGDRHWPVFEFRLSANNVRKGKWSHLPKLEFPLPEGNQPKQFDNWFEEAEDDKGAKFELRFDMKAPAVDVAAWTALSSADQAQAIALVQSLPSLLNQLEQAGTPIHRPWADWHVMASGIRHAVTTCLGLKIGD